MIFCQQSEFSFEEDDTFVALGFRGHSHGVSPAINLQFPLQVDRQDIALSMNSAFVDYSDEHISQQGGYGLLRRVSVTKDNCIKLQLSAEAIDCGIPDCDYVFAFGVALDFGTLAKLESLCGRLMIPFEKKHL